SYSSAAARPGMRRRSAASRSLARVTAFSFTSSSCQAASHSCAETIGGVFMAPSPPASLRSVDHTDTTRSRNWAMARRLPLPGADRRQPARPLCRERARRRSLAGRAGSDAGPVVARGGAPVPEEGAGESVFGAVAHGVGDVGHALVGVAEAAGGDVEAPTGEVLQRRPADELGEPAGEAGPRQADRRSELGHR